MDDTKPEIVRRLLVLHTYLNKEGVPLDNRYKAVTRAESLEILDWRIAAYKGDTKIRNAMRELRNELKERPEHGKNKFDGTLLYGFILVII